MQQAYYRQNKHRSASPEDLAVAREVLPKMLSK